MQTTGTNHHEQPERITTLEEALAVARKWSDQSAWQSSNRYTYNSPFGIWYRGQSSCWKLVPSVFRGEESVLNETSLYHHFKLLRTDFSDAPNSCFDWLAVMQHYGLPTRLLDWSESILIALYFAVCDHEKEDGQLFVLNAGGLNVETNFKFEPARGPDQHGIHIPENFNVLLRANMAPHGALRDLLRANEILSSDENDAPRMKLRKRMLDSLEFSSIPTAEDEALKGFLKLALLPAAVYPYRHTPRAKLQQSVFTIHGGKRHTYAQRKKATLRLLDGPVHLEEMKTKDRFLKCYQIPYEGKAAIAKDLKTIGIHHGSLFPEIDQQARHIRGLWTYANEGLKEDHRPVD